MWRPSINENSFRGEAYAYVSKTQHPDFDKLPGVVRNVTYGDSMFRGQFTLYKKRWNHISLTCKLGTPGKFDGFLSLTMNDVTCSYDKMNYVDTNSIIKGTGVISHFFFGGKDEFWSTPVDTSIYTTNYNLVPY
jgi:hypothetical protein